MRLLEHGHWKQQFKKLNIELLYEYKIPSLQIMLTFVLYFIEIHCHWMAQRGLRQIFQRRFLHYPQRKSKQYHRKYACVCMYVYIVPTI